MVRQPELDTRRLAVLGLGQAGIVSLLAGGAATDRFATVAAANVVASYVTTTAYPDGTRMGLLAPGILKAGDVPHLTALNAPRKMVVAGATMGGKVLEPRSVEEAFAFTRKIYRLYKADAALTLRGATGAAGMVELLG